MTPPIERRRFLHLMASAGALGLVSCGTDPVSIASATPSDHQLQDKTFDRRPPSTDRNIVVVELRGGNDGLAMLQPGDTGALEAVRPDLLADGTELIDAGDGFRWHPGLAPLTEYGVAGVVGVGSNDPSFSHFEMEQRWWRGESGSGSRQATGFFGRICDQLHVGDPVTGLSLGGLATPALWAEEAVTVGLGDVGSTWFLNNDDPWIEAYRETLAMMGGDVGGELAHDAARRGLEDMTRFADALGGFELDGDERYPWGDLGQQLRVASHVLALDVGVRVIHLSLGGFDTHEGQSWRHGELMGELAEGLAVFVDHLGELGIRERTLVATTSEFGRRVEQNDGGTDHGGASSMLLCGPGTSGVLGEAPSLTDLDEGNLVATARFEDYYATIAEDWFGIGAAEVLPTGGEVIDGVLSA